MIPHGRPRPFSVVDGGVGWGEQEEGMEMKQWLVCKMSKKKFKKEHMAKESLDKVNLTSVVCCYTTPTRIR